MIKLGETYKDNLSGIAGRAVSITEYEFGCRRVTLEFIGKTAEGNKTCLEATFDEQRLIAKSKAKKGGPGNVPQKRSMPKRRG